MRWDDGDECVSKALLVAISAVILRDQAPELAIQPIKLSIRAVEDGLDMIEQPGAHTFEVTLATKVGANRFFKLMPECCHGATS